MAGRCKEPGHQQLWHWPGCPEHSGFSTSRAEDIRNRVISKGMPATSTYWRLLWPTPIYTLIIPLMTSKWLMDIRIEIDSHVISVLYTGMLEGPCILVPSHVMAVNSTRHVVCICTSESSCFGFVLCVRFAKAECDHQVMIRTWLMLSWKQSFL